MTKLGRAWMYDVNISQCFHWLKDDISVGPSNHIDSNDHVTTPSAGSSTSHDNMVTPPATTHMSSLENSSRLVSLLTLDIRHYRNVFNGKLILMDAINQHTESWLLI